MLKLIGKFLVLNVALASFSVAAQETTPQLIQTCHLTEDLNLNVPTQIECADSQLIVDPGVQIVRNGFSLQIVSAGQCQLGHSEMGLEIVDADGNDGPLFIFCSLTATGHLNRKIKGSCEGGNGGDVMLNYGSTFEYEQTIDSCLGSSVQTTVAGQELLPQAPERKLQL